MNPQTKYKIFRLLCLLPFYFGIVALITFYISDYYKMLSFDSAPPPPPGTPLASPVSIEIKRICMKLFYSHFPALVLYSALSFPVTTVLAINLYKVFKKKTLVLYTLYLLIPLYLLFFFPNLIPF